MFGPLHCRPSAVHCLDIRTARSCPFGTKEQYVLFASQGLRADPKFIVVRIGKWCPILLNTLFETGYENFVLATLPQGPGVADVGVWAEQCQINCDKRCAISGEVGSSSRHHSTVPCLDATRLIFCARVSMCRRRCDCVTDNH